MITPKILSTNNNELRSIKHLKIGFYPENLKEEMINDVILKLEHCENLEVFEIDLFCREFEQDQVYDLTKNLQKSPCINKIALDLRNSSLNHKDCKHLGQNLSKCQNLEILDLKINSCSIFIEGANVLTEGLSKLKNLRTLNLQISNSKLNKSLKLNGEIKELEIGQNLLLCKKLIYLDMRLETNQLGEKPICIMLDSLSKIKLLEVFKWSLVNTQITEDGLTTLGILIGKMNNLKQLQLTFGNHMFSFSRCLKEMLISDLQDLFLDFSRSKLTLDDLTMLTNRISNQVELKKMTINLDDNQIVGNSPFGESFLNTPQLMKLELHMRKNQLEDQIWIDLSRSLGALEQLQELSLSCKDNYISDKNLGEFGKNLGKSKSITDLWVGIGDNNNTDSGVLVFLEGVQEMENVEKISLYLDDCKIEGEGLAHFGKVKQHCKQYCVYLNGVGLKDKGFQLVFSNPNSYIRELDLPLNNNCFSKDAFLNLGTNINGFNNLWKLSITFIQTNFIGEGFFKLFGQEIAKCKYLKCLDIKMQQSIKLTVQEYFDLAYYLSKTETLTFLDILAAVGMTPQQKQKVKWSLQKSRTIVHLILKL